MGNDYSVVDKDDFGRAVDNTYSSGPISTPNKLVNKRQRYVAPSKYAQPNKKPKLDLLPASNRVTSSKLLKTIEPDQADKPEEIEEWSDEETPGPSKRHKVDESILNDVSEMALELMQNPNPNTLDQVTFSSLLRTAVMEPGTTMVAVKHDDIQNILALKDQKKANKSKEIDNEISSLKRKFIDTLVKDKVKLDQKSPGFIKFLDTMLTMSYDFDIKCEYTRESLERDCYAAGLRKSIKLYDSQVQGINFILNNWNTRGSVLLAHEMGLGKTLQTLISISLQYYKKPGTALILCPSNLLKNWVNEATKYFNNKLKIMAYAGKDKVKAYGQRFKDGVNISPDFDERFIGRFDLVIASYNALQMIWNEKVYVPVQRQVGRFKARDMSESEQRMVMRTYFPQLDWDTFTKVKSNSRTISFKLKKNGGSIPLVGPLIGYPYTIIGVDEAHKLKNSTSIIANMCHAFNAPHRIMMTGTPQFNSINDLWSLFKAMDVKELVGESDFKSRTRALVAVMEMEEDKRKMMSNFYSEVEPTENAQEIEQDLIENMDDAGKLLETIKWNTSKIHKDAKYVLDLLNQYMHKISKRDLGLIGKTDEELALEKGKYAKEGWTLTYHSMEGLPAVYEKVRAIEPSSMLRKVYNSIQTTTKAEFAHVDRRDTSTFMLSIITHLRMLCSNPSTVKTEVYQKHCDARDVALLIEQEPQKLAELINYFIEEVKPDEKVIIFTHFIETANMLDSTLNERGFKTLSVTGKLTPPQKNTILEAFQKMEDYRFLVATHCVSHGVNLPRANHVVFMEYWYNDSETGQCWARVHRLGQQRDIKILKFMFKGMIDEHMKEISDSKEKVNRFSTSQMKRVLQFDC